MTTHLVQELILQSKHTLIFEIPGLFFLYFRLFITVDSKLMLNINFADACI